MLDFGALEKTQAAIDPVRDRAAEKGVLEDPRLRVRPVKDRNLRQPVAFALQRADLFDNEARLLHV